MARNRVTATAGLMSGGNVATFFGKKLEYTMEHDSDQAIGECVGECLKIAKAKGIDIKAPDFVVVIDFLP